MTIEKEEFLVGKKDRGVALQSKKRASYEGEPRPRDTFGHVTLSIISPPWALSTKLIHNHRVPEPL